VKTIVDGNAVASRAVSPLDTNAKKHLEVETKSPIKLRRQLNQLHLVQLMREDAKVDYMERKSRERGYVKLC